MRQRVRQCSRFGKRSGVGPTRMGLDADLVPRVLWGSFTLTYETNAKPLPP